MVFSVFWCVVRWGVFKELAVAAVQSLVVEMLNAILDLLTLLLGHSLVVCLIAVLR